MREDISIHFENKLQEARFLERPNRFLLRCGLPAVSANSPSVMGEEIVEAHLADPGRLRELLAPRTVWLRPVNGTGRKTKWSAALCESPAGDSLVSIDATLPNRLVGKALLAGALEEFAGWSLVRPEFPLGGSRWDFLLKSPGGRRLLLEVKSVTLVEGKTALFPDALTARGAKHMRELAEIVRNGEYEAAVMFVVQRDEAILIQAAPQIDPAFAAALADAVAAGVNIYGRKCRVSLTGVTLGEQLPAG
ncbi:MAG: DNA/RNA nuclease SfsA [Bacillota bacterium]